MRPYCMAEKPKMEMDTTPVFLELVHGERHRIVNEEHLGQTAHAKSKLRICQKMALKRCGYQNIVDHSIICLLVTADTFLDRHAGRAANIIGSYSDNGNR
jgi:hypothetical protein